MKDKREINNYEGYNENKNGSMFDCRNVLKLEKRDGYINASRWNDNSPEGWDNEWNIIKNSFNSILKQY